MAVIRSTRNPIIEPKDVRPSRPDFEVACVINAGVARLGDEVILLLRVVERPINTNPEVYLAPIYDASNGELFLKAFPRGAPGYNFSDSRLIGTPEGVYLTALSHLRVARSQDGVDFVVDESPAMFPANAYEAYGIEDPRITQIGSTYYVNYVAVSPRGIVTSLAATRDFKSFERLGIIFPPDNKDVAIFPEKVNGKYYALHRPSTSGFGRPEIWLAESPDLMCWGNHHQLIGTRDNGWEDGRIGASAVPFRVDAGWLAIYHSATKGNRYHLAGLLLDANEPWKVLGRSKYPIMAPEAAYELEGFFGNVVFSCGALVENGVVKIYYGAADTCMGLAEISVAEILQSLE